MWGNQLGIDDSTIDFLNVHSDGFRQLWPLYRSTTSPFLSVFAFRFSQAVAWSMLHNYTTQIQRSRSGQFSYRGDGVVEYIT